MRSFLFFKSTTSSLKDQRAFSLVELLIVIVVIAILAAMAITAMTNATFDSSERVAQQQQAVLQEALMAWISSNASASASSSLSSARANYTASTNKLALIEKYLDARTYSNFTTTNNIESEALKKIGGYLSFSAWTANATTYPTVNYNANP